MAAVSAALCAFPSAASAVGTGETFVSDGITYKVLSSEYAMVGDGRVPAVAPGATNVTIPSTVTTEGGSYSVVLIGDSAFRGRSSLTSVGIPDSVLVIGGYAFRECPSLTSVVLPESVTSIGESAFEWCSSLASVAIPDSVTSIGEFAFAGCSSLTDVAIPGSVTSISHATFGGCSALAAVPIPESVTSIGTYAFSGCSSLTSVAIPESVTSIGGYAFAECYSLTSVVIPDSVTSIGGNAFLDCSSLESVTIPRSVSTLSHATFWGCSSLESVTIPDSVTSIGTAVFMDCWSLKSVAIPGSVTSVGMDAFSGCSSLAEILLDVDRPALGLRAFPPGARILTDISSASITGLPVCYAYTGSAVTPMPTLVLSGEASPARTLTSDDYTMSYSDNVAVGTGTITITGRNDYGGTLVTQFAIRRRAALSRSTSWSSLASGRTYYAKGFISPAHSPGDANKVRIRAYKKGADGTYRYVKSFTANYSPYSSAKSRYTAAVRLTSRGRWRLVAYHAADTGNAASSGSADYVVVK